MALFDYEKDFAGLTGFDITMGLPVEKDALYDAEMLLNPPGILGRRRVRKDGERLSILWLSCKQDYVEAFSHIPDIEEPSTQVYFYLNGVDDESEVGRIAQICCKRGIILYHTKTFFKTSTARALLASYARGAYLMFVDADDEIIPFSTNELNGISNAMPDIVTFLAKRHNPNGDRVVLDPDTLWCCLLSRKAYINALIANPIDTLHCEDTLIRHWVEEHAENKMFCEALHYIYHEENSKCQKKCNSLEEIILKLERQIPNLPTIRQLSEEQFHYAAGVITSTIRNYTREPWQTGILISVIVARLCKFDVPTYQDMMKYVKEVLLWEHSVQET